MVSNRLLGLLFGYSGEFTSSSRRRPTRPSASSPYATIAGTEKDRRTCDAGPARPGAVVRAQEADGTWPRALAELRAGRKVGHWMCVFPQLAGLGRSETARHYATGSLPEAEAYLRHDLLGPRLVEAAKVTASWAGRPTRAIFGDTDAMKLRSSMTLFATAAADPAAFDRVLDAFFAGRRDAATVALLAGSG